MPCVTNRIATLTDGLTLFSFSVHECPQGIALTYLTYTKDRLYSHSVPVLAQWGENVPTKSFIKTECVGSYLCIGSAAGWLRGASTLLTFKTRWGRKLLHYLILTHLNLLSLHRNSQLLSFSHALFTCFHSAAAGRFERAQEESSFEKENCSFL